MAIETLSNTSYFADYHFECCCGERFKTAQHGAWCKKCSSYSVWGYTKYVIDTRTNEVVHGEMPTEKEYKAAEAQAVIRWKAEQEYCEREIASYRKEEFDASEERSSLDEEEARLDAMCAMWDEQERLSS